MTVRSVLLVLLGSLALASPALAGMSMSASEPEHVADALAALNKGQTHVAAGHLRDAISTMAEPAAARHHASEALAALRRGQRTSARHHAQEGAAVEHLTYALRALNAKQNSTAEGHLNEAKSIPEVASDARAALKALGKGNRTAAIAATRRGLARVT